MIAGWLSIFENVDGVRICFLHADPPPLMAVSVSLLGEYLVAETASKGQIH